MMNRQAELMEIKSITRWIDSADRWIDELEQRFSSMGSPLTGMVYTGWSASEDSLYRIGRDSWEKYDKRTDIRFPAGLSTREGAQAARAHVLGLRESARMEWQRRLDQLADSVRQSCADDRAGKAAASSLPPAEPSKTEPSQARPSDDEHDLEV